MYQKKEELIRDITILLQGYNYQNGHTLIGLVRKGLGDLLLLGYHHTFEELIDAVNHFKETCNAIRGKLDGIEKERSQLLSNKELRHDKQFVNKLKELKLKKEEHLTRLQRCHNLGESLENAKVKETVISLCKTLSEIQFSRQRVSKDTCTRIIFSFLWIINQLFLQENIQKAAKGPTQDIEGLIGVTKNALQMANVRRASESYQLALEAYHGLSNQEQARYYADVFILWFEIQFFDHRSKGLNNTASQWTPL